MVFLLTGILSLPMIRASLQLQQWLLDLKINVLPGAAERMPMKYRSVLLVLLVCLSFVVYFVFIRLLEPAYVIKAAGKILLFVLIPAVYQRISDVPVLRPWVRTFWPRKLNWRQLAFSVAGGLLLLGLVHILAGPINQLFKIEQAVQDVAQRNNSSVLTLIAAFIYIPLINAFAEEAFFRGFINLELGRIESFGKGSTIAALLFAVYHLTLFRDWFSFPILVLVLGSLFMASLYLNALTARDQSILRAWILHAFVNVAILSLTVRFYTF